MAPALSLHLFCVHPRGACSLAPRFVVGLPPGAPAIADGLEAGLCGWGP